MRNIIVASMLMMILFAVTAISNTNVAETFAAKSGSGLKQIPLTLPAFIFTGTLANTSNQSTVNKNIVNQLNLSSNDTKNSISYLSTQKWQTYSDPLFGIRFAYPNDWTVVEDSTDHLTIKGSSSTAYLTVTANDVISNETLDRLTRKYGEELKSIFVSGPSILHELNPVNILSINRTDIGVNNSIANEMAYEIGQPSDSQRTKGLAFLTKGNEGRLYILTYENTVADFESVLPNFLKIIQSFQSVGLLS